MSTAFDAKTSLVNLLRASFPDLAADQAIWYGYVGQAGNRPREVIWVGEITWEDEVGAALGAFRRDETYRITLTVESHFPGDDQETANARVRDRAGAVEELLKDPRALSVPGVYECGIIPQMLGEGSDPAGRGAIFVTFVRVRARI